MKEQCPAGCQHFTGGEVKHDKHCPFYPESLSKRYDEMDSRIPNSYLLEFDEITHRETSIIATKYENGKPRLWAIRANGVVFSKITGSFHYEPFPPSQDNIFINEFRFESVSEAEESYYKFFKRKP